MKDRNNLNWHDKNILIVDDEDMNFYFLEAALGHTQANIIRAENGQQAVELCINGNCIDLVLMDINMPVMDGFEATKQIKNYNKTTPVIAQTAYTIFDLEEKDDVRVFDECLHKPINVPNLIGILIKYLC